MILNNDEHIEYIGEKLQLIVSKAHTFGTDALLLASFASPNKNSLACDFGTGCGIIPFYWLRENLCQQIYTVEIQEKGYNQLVRSIEINSAEKIIPYNCDLREIPVDIPKGKFDLITMNPPYTKENSGVISESDSDKIARHGIMCSLEDVCQTASKMLKFGGRLCMCLRPERLFELTCAMQKFNIEPKRLRFVSQRDGLTPWLVLVEGKLGRKPGLFVEPELHIENTAGELSAEMIKILGTYRKE